MASSNFIDSGKKIYEESKQPIEQFILYDNTTLNSILSMFANEEYKNILYDVNFCAISIDRELNIEIKFRDNNIDKAKQEKKSINNVLEDFNLNENDNESQYVEEKSQELNNILVTDSIFKDLNEETKKETEKIPEKNAIITPLEYIKIIENMDMCFNNEAIENPMEKYMKEKILDIDMFFNPVNIKLDFVIEIVKVVEDGSKIYFGCENGNILKVSNIEKSKHEIFCPLSLPKKVTALDIKDNYIVAGYENALIVIWDSKDKIQKKFDKLFLDSAIMCIHIVKVVKNKIKALVSDKNGKVCLIKKSTFWSTKTLINDDRYYPYPFFLLDHIQTNFIEFNESEEKNLNKYNTKEIYLPSINFKAPKGRESRSMSVKKTSNHKKGNIYLLVSLKEFIALTSIKGKKKNENTSVMPNLNFNDTDAVPDIAVGKGIVPFESKSKLDSLKRAQKDPQIDDDFFNTVYFTDMISRIELNMFLVCKGPYLYMIVPLYQKKDPGLKLFIFGRYIHHRNIYRVGFISNSFIFFIDDSLKLKIINTFSFDLYTEENRDNFFFTELKEPIVIRELDLRRLNLAYHELTEPEKKKQKEYYSKSVAPFSKGVVLNGKKEFYWVLKTWTVENCVDAELKKDNREKLICLLYALVSKKHSPLYLFNSHENISSFIEMMLSKFISKEFIEKEGNRSEKDKIFKLLIDFSIQMNITDLLFEIIHNLCAEKKNYLPLFLETLSEFILRDQFKRDDNFRESIILDLIDYYCPNIIKINSDENKDTDKDKNNNENKIISNEEIIENNKDYERESIKTNENRTILSKLLLHLSCNALNKPTILQVITNNDFIHVYLYLQMNLTTSVIEMFKSVIFILGNFLSRKNTSEYKRFILEQNKMLSPEICSSKQYYGHWLLFILNIILDGHIYPDKTQMSDKQFSELSLLIYGLMSTKKNAEHLLLFDSFSFFEVYKRFYTEEILFKKISVDYTKCSFFFKTVFDIGIDDKLITPKKVLEVMIENCKKLPNNFYIMIDLYTFIINALNSKPLLLELDQSMMLDACCYILSNLGENDVNVEDPFYCHSTDIVHYNERQKRIEEELLNIICKIKPNLSKEDLNNLETNIEKSKFNIIKIEIFEEKKDYLKCLDAYLEFYSNKEQVEKKEKVVKIYNVFDWINKTLEYLNKKKQEIARKFIKHISDKSESLALIDIKGVIGLMENYFVNEHEMIIDNLNNIPQIQLEIVKFILNKINKDPFLSDKLSKENEKKKPEEQNKLIKEEENFKYTDLNNLSRLDHLYMLFLKDKYAIRDVDGVIDILRERPYLCTADSLEVLLDVGEYKTALFVYKIIGEYTEGIKKGSELIDTMIQQVNDMFSNQKKNNVFNNQKFIQLLKEESIYVDMTLDIMKIQYEQERPLFDWNNNQMRDNDPWYVILRNLYSQKINWFHLYMKQDDYDWKDKKRENEYEQRYNSLSDYIERVLEAMCEFESLTLIMEKVSNSLPFVGFREFRQIILHHINSSIRTEAILEQSKTISNKIDFRFYQNLFDLSRKGRIFPLKNCSKCYKQFSELSSIEKDMINFFHCGHQFHSFCCTKEKGEYVCGICRKKKVELYIELGVELEHPPQIKEEDYLELIKQGNSSFIGKEKDIKRQKKKEKLKNTKKTQQRYLDYMLTYQIGSMNITEADL